MAVNLSPVAGAAAQFFDNSGNVLTGGKLYTYDAGTTTPAPTYTNSSGVTAQPNPIILNAAGRVPDSGEIWLSDSVSYKFVLKDQNDVLIGTYDNLVGINSNFVNFTGEEEQQTATQGQTVFTLTTLVYSPSVNNLLVFVNGSKQISGTNYQETSSTVITFVDGLNVGDVVDFCTATPINTNTVTAAQVMYDEGCAGSVSRSVEAKLQEYVSVLDFGADPTGVTDSTAAIQAALDCGGIGSTIYVPKGEYYIDGTLTKYPGQIIQGDGWSTSVGYAVDGGSVLVQHSTSDVNFIQILGTSDNDQKERGGLRDIALVCNTASSAVGTGYDATYARQQYLNNVFIAGFRTGLYYGPQVWLSLTENVRVGDCRYGLVCNSSSEDNVFISCQFQSYQLNSIGIHLQNQSANTTFITCYVESCTNGVVLSQGDSNGDGTGSPYPMHATFIGCLFENFIDTAITLVTSNQNASNTLHPGITLIHPRLYIGSGWGSATPNNGQSIIYATHASQINVQDVYANGFSYGATLGIDAYGSFVSGSLMGPVYWGLDNNAVYGTSRVRGQLGCFTKVPGNAQSCSLYSNALSYTANNYTPIPFANITSDTSNWAYVAGNAIKPTRGGQLVRFYAQVNIPSALASRYALILYKNGSNFASLDDITTSATSTILSLKGEFWDTPNGTTDQYTVVLYANANCSISAAANNTFFNANLVGN